MSLSHLAHRRPCRISLPALVFCAFSLSAAGAEELAAGSVHALLINGGHRPASNYLSHLHHIEEMLDLLDRRGLRQEHIHIFSADGKEEGADLAARDTLPSEFWLIEDTRIGNRLRPRTELSNTEWPDVTVHPARRDALQEWFESASQELAPGDQLLIFVTDHGTENREDPDNGAISLWNEKLSVQGLKKLLARLHPGVQVVMVMSQCYSGTFANAMYPGEASQPSGNVCGFFSTTRDLTAYGCYPEGRDRDKIGHAFRFIDALGRRPTTAEAHLEVLVTDDTPDVPLRTSDVYLERLVSAEAAARGVEVNALVDSLLAEAWRDRAAWEPEIRLLDRIGEAFGMFSPRSLSELSVYSNELQNLTDQMKTYARSWKTALVDVKEVAMRDFLSERPEWRPRLEDQALTRLSASERGALLAELLPELVRYAPERPEIWKRLENLRDLARRSSEAEWRLEVRRAANRRMRSILIAIAGRVLVEGSGESLDRAVQLEALERLEQCEALSAGTLPNATVASQTPVVEPFPSLAQDIALLEEVLPSWLGVRFHPVSESIRASRHLPRGATLLEAVYPDSPAEEAGLTAGDIVLGPPGRPFDSSGELREWTMTSPRDVPLPLEVIRPGSGTEEDLSFEVSLVLRPYPLDMPRLPGPPQVGDRAPVLPTAIAPVGTSELPDLKGRAHLLFFWATWCGPCKKAVPETMAFAEAKGLPVLAISDEDLQVVNGFLESWEKPFFPQIAVDGLRMSFIAYGVSGTPTILLVDGDGVIRHRQVGYDPGKGLTVEGWSWPSP